MREETQESHVVQNAEDAPDAEQVKMPLSSANCPSGTGSSTPAVSPLFEGTFVNSLQFDLDNSQQNNKPLERKRRRIIGNMDNTLDGLVAKRAEIDPNSKRYQTENEAIELPDDETEMKRLENDPDVSTRMCSICGYQGKWVSEMIRHKRVHTQERPFKCKYCNRTSKWKADLIRHVAKTHGIRVVSKYSRSKAFDTQGDHSEEHIVKNVPKMKEINNNNKIHSSIIQQKPTFKAPNAPSMVYKCSICFFEQDSMEACVTHLHTLHNLSPFECQRCNLNFKNVQLVSTHCAQSNAACTPLHIKINFQIISSTITSQPNTPSYQVNQPKQVNQGLLTVATASNHMSLPLDSDTASSAPSSCSTNTDYEMSTQPGSTLNACTDCPYRTPSIQKLATHRQGHQMPRGLFNYKCVFCNWFAKKKSAIEKHMQVHTSKPSQFMAQVERNLITPLTTSNLIGGASAPVQQNLIAPMAASAPLSSTALGLLSALYSGGNLLQGSSPIAPSPMQSAPSSANLPDIGAFKELTTNPLLAFSLCSLLENLNNQQTTLRSPFLPMVNGNSFLSSANLSAFDQSSRF